MSAIVVSQVNGFEEGRAEDTRGWLAMSATKLYILGGCVLALVLIVLLQATCTLVRPRRSPPAKKEQLITSASAWSAANTNYAFDVTDYKQQPPMQMQKVPAPMDPRYGVPRSTYSLPRTVMAERMVAAAPAGYYTHDRRAAHAQQQHRGQHPNGLQPDFYFMPSQRKYSGEVVRVYVDYNKPTK